MSLFQIGFNLMVDNLHVFGALLIIYILLDIIGWAFLGKRK